MKKLVKVAAVLIGTSVAGVLAWRKVEGHNPVLLLAGRREPGLRLLPRLARFRLRAHGRSVCCGP